MLLTFVLMLQPGWEMVEEADASAAAAAASNASDGASNDVTDSGGPAMAPGWEERRDRQGRLFYVNHTTRATQWERPVAG